MTRGLCTKRPSVSRFCKIFVQVPQTVSSALESAYGCIATQVDRFASRQYLAWIPGSPEFAPILFPSQIAVKPDSGTEMQNAQLLIEEASKIATAYLAGNDDRREPVARRVSASELQERFDLAPPREGRPLEWDVRNAVVGRLARRHGIATPLNDALTAMLSAADRGRSGA